MSGAPRRDLARRTDEELVRAVAQIEPAPFEVLSQRHGAVAFGLARRMLGSQGPPPAEDAVQEAFISLWRGAARYNPARGSVRSWLLGMLRHRSIDMLRRLDALYNPLGAHRRGYLETRATWGTLGSRGDRNGGLRASALRIVR